MNSADRCARILRYVDESKRNDNDIYHGLITRYENMRSEIGELFTVYKCYYYQRANLPCFTYNKKKQTTLMDIFCSTDKGFFRNESITVFIGITNKPYMRNFLVRIKEHNFDYVEYIEKTHKAEVVDLPIKTKIELLQNALDTLEDFMMQFYSYIDNLGGTN